MSYYLWSYHIRDNSVEKLQSIQNSGWFFEKHNLKNYYVLATCNRYEVLVHTDKTEIPKNIYPNLKVRFYKEPHKIINHLLKVSLSTDSVVFGENQILGQMKKALLEQKSHIGNELNKLLQLTFRESKFIRHQTELSRLQTSVSSVAVKSIQNVFPNKNTSILVVGYGETNQLLIKSLEKKKYKNIAVTNRTYEKIKNLKCQKIKWQDFLNGKLANYDVICLATSSKEYILTPPCIENTKPKLVVDLCIPANADKKIVIKNGSLYLGLKEIQKTLKVNEREVKRIKSQIESYLSESVEKIFIEISTQTLNSYISQRIKELEGIQMEAQKDLNSLFNNLTEDQKDAFSDWSIRLVKKINHLHLTGYKEAFQIGFKKNDLSNRNSR